MTKAEPPPRSVLKGSQGVQAVWEPKDESRRNTLTLQNSSVLVLTLVQHQYSWGKGTPVRTSLVM